MENDGTTGAIIGVIIVVYLLVFAFALVVAIALYVVTAIAYSRLFRKVGIEGWIAWVPYYNTWKALELGGQPGWLALLSLVGGGIVTSVFRYIGMWRTGIAFRKDAGFLVLGIFLPFVWAFLLARPQEQYHPEYITAAGYGPPLAGYGSAPRPGYTPPTA
ncbi:hypothetical protein BH11ACT2_BH11ACT2_10480 [soil metagenome]